MGITLVQYRQICQTHTTLDVFSCAVSDSVLSVLLIHSVNTSINTIVDIIMLNHASPCMNTLYTVAVNWTMVRYALYSYSRSIQHAVSNTGLAGQLEMYNNDNSLSTSLSNLRSTAQRRGY